ncbi:MAG: hypothetical protein RL344_1039 [Pseudomonadota bacterium]|jgi:hypothetical protein
MTNFTYSDEDIKTLNTIIDNVELEKNINYLFNHRAKITILNNRATKKEKADALIKHQNEHIKNQQAIQRHYQQRHYQQIENRLNSLSLFDYINKYSVSNRLRRLLLSSKAISIFKEIYLIDLIKINTIDKKSIFLRLKDNFKPWVLEELLAHLDVCLYELTFGFVDVIDKNITHQFFKVKPYCLKPIHYSQKHKLLENIALIEKWELFESEFDNSYFLQMLKYAVKNFNLSQI